MSRALVTGIGVVAPNGVGVEEYWSATLAGKSGLRTLAHLESAGYPLRVGGVADAFVALQHLPGRLVAQIDRWTALGLAAASAAFEDAGLEPSSLSGYDLGVLTASSSGGNEFGQREIERLWSQGPQFVGAYQSIACLPSAQWIWSARMSALLIRFTSAGAEFAG